jgi:hypothetical protein
MFKVQFFKINCSKKLKIKNKIKKIKSKFTNCPKLLSPNDKTILIVVFKIKN